MVVSPQARAQQERWEPIRCLSCNKRNIDIDRERGLLRFRCSDDSCRCTQVAPIDLETVHGSGHA